MGPGQVVGGRFEAQELILRGGLKEVWRGVDREGGSPVAIACLLRFEPRLFANEVELASRVESPNVARVLGGFVENGEACVVSELCEGPDLRRILVRRGRLDAPVAVPLLHEYAEGLAALHNGRILHRDVKPENAVLTAACVKVVDFGISLPAIDRLPGGELLPAGTLPYLAPECFEGRVDGRADVYALGVTGFELLAGRLPFASTNAREAVTRLRARVPLDLAALEGQPPSLRALLGQMVAMSLDERPHMGEVVAALRQLRGSAALPSVAAVAAAMPVASMPTTASPPQPARPQTSMPVPPVARPPQTSVPAPPVARATPLPPAAAPVLAPGPPRPSTMAVGPLRLRARLSHDGALAPRRVVPTPWPFAPVVTLAARGAATDVSMLDGDFRLRWRALARGALEGGLVVDLDGDGVGELLLYGPERLLSVDASGKLRFELSLPPALAAAPAWEREATAPVVLERGAAGRALAIAGVVVDGRGRLVGPFASRYQSDSGALIPAAGTRGFSAHGAAGQAFRGALATPAAILTRPGTSSFQVAALELERADKVTLSVGLYGQGGRRLACSVVGSFDPGKATGEEQSAALRPDARLFDEVSAPLAILRDDSDTVLVPFLVNNWFGPVIVAFDGRTGAERWRVRLRALGHGPQYPPLLADLEGNGQPEVILAQAGGLARIEVATGRALPVLPGVDGIPVAAWDPEGRGRTQLLFVGSVALEIWEGPACLPGLLSWVGQRGDLWRTGTLGVDGLPCGPRA